MEFKPSLPPLPEKKEAKEPLSFPEEMYAVSGFLSPNSRHYEKSKRFDAEIQSITDEITAIEHLSVTDPDLSSRLAMGFNSSTEVVQTSALRQIYKLELPTQLEIIEKYLHLFRKNKMLLQEVIQMITSSTLTEEVASFFTDQALSHDIPEQVQASLIRATRNPSLVADLLSRQPSETLTLAAIRKMALLPPQERSQLIHLFYSSNSELIKKAILDEVVFFPPTENERVLSLLEEALSSGTPSLQIAAIANIGLFPPQKKILKIKQALNSPDEEVRIQALRQVIIQHTPPRSITIDDEILNQAKKALDSGSIPLVEVGIDYLKFFDKNTQKKYIQKILNSPADNHLHVTLITSSLFSPNERLRLLHDPRFTEIIISTPLYKNTSLDGDTLGREKFEKTGSETTLLGGTLKNKLIIRHITPNAFVSWQKAYEDWQNWELAEFDYTPIEPIQAYRLNRVSGIVEVASGVLDLNLQQWTNLFPNLYSKELAVLKKQIEDTLDTMGINHGHPHEGNFALRFFRNEDGTIDLGKVPRLYLIDFDQAKS